MNNIYYEEIKKITGIDIELIFNDFADFMDFDFIKIKNYYEGKLDNNYIDSFRKLKDLEENVDNLLVKINKSSSSFSNIIFWDLLDIIENIKNKIKTINVLSKFLRTSIVNAQYDSGINQQEFLVRQNQLLRGVAWAELKSKDPNNDWVDIAIKNNLREEDYDNSGRNPANTNEGFFIKINFKNNGTITQINSVVDNINGENILGRDIKQILTFKDEDLEVLNYQETASQSADILIGLKKGDNPEFWLDGIPSSLLGQGQIIFAYPVLFRKIVEIFKSDDTFDSFRVSNIKNEKDGIFITLEIETIINSTMTKDLTK